jgi:hypothetical protein
MDTGPGGLVRGGVKAMGLRSFALPMVSAHSLYLLPVLTPCTYSLLPLPISKPCFYSLYLLPVHRHHAWPPCAGVFTWGGHIYVANREAHEVLVFDKEGSLVRVLPGVPDGSRCGVCTQICTLVYDPHATHVPPFAPSAIYRPIYIYNLYIHRPITSFHTSAM